VTRANAPAAAAPAVDARTRAWATLAHARLPQQDLVALLREAGDPEVLVAAARARASAATLPAAARAAIAGVPDDALATTLAWLAEPSHRLVALDDPDYPRALIAIGDTPPALFAIGRLALFNTPAVAIVGSRQATPQGRDDATAFARTLAAAGLTVVSGLAEGIDAAAHEGALAEAASTIAVVGTGLDRVYPAANRRLAHAIAERGLLVSEFVPGAPPDKWHFPRRNRLISALARGVLVIEAGVSSGSLITARFAGEQGREVMAVPGSIHSPLSKGCHKLIREGAKLVETAQDVLVELGIAPTRVPADADTEPRAIDPTHATLLAAMGEAPVDIDRLVARTGLGVAAIASQLTAMALDGHVEAMAGGRWQRRH
jgi:DNA processing protein